MARLKYCIEMRIEKERHKHIIWLVFIFLLLTNINLSAQKGFSLAAGWGKYELFNIGGQWNISERSSLSVFAGSNLGLNNIKAWSGGLYFDQVFLKPIIWKLKPGYSLGAIYWQQDDELYTFQTLSFPFMALLAYPVFPFLTVRAEGGIILSSVLVAERKQNVQSGYPDRFNGNFRINVICKLGKK